jgi:hypothetical protein
MTEAEWLKSDDPIKMFKIDGVRLTYVKVWRLWIEGSRLLCDAHPGCDRSGLDNEERRLEAGDFTQFCHPDTPGVLDVGPEAFGVHFVCSLDLDRRKQAELLREIIGNPFRPVALDPAWRTPTVVALASQMYESRDFGAMPILADALQDAGCDNEEVLHHCRGPGPHVRGCWVLDLVLGKE